jgi:hypothetical protein
LNVLGRGYSTRSSRCPEEHHQGNKPAEQMASGEHMSSTWLARPNDLSAGGRATEINKSIPHDPIREVRSVKLIFDSAPSICREATILSLHVGGAGIPPDQGSRRISIWGSAHRMDHRIFDNLQQAAPSLPYLTLSYLTKNPRISSVHEHRT